MLVDHDGYSHAHDRQTVTRDQSSQDINSDSDSESPETDAETTTSTYEPDVKNANATPDVDVIDPSTGPFVLSESDLHINRDHGLQVETEKGCSNIRSLLSTHFKWKWQRKELHWIGAKVRLMYMT